MFKKICLHPKKGVVVKPILSKQPYARVQVDLIDMQSSKDGEYKFIFKYQDHVTKYTVLKLLKTKSAVEVCYNLIDVFCTFPLQRFCNRTMDENLSIR